MSVKKICASLTGIALSLGVASAALAATDVEIYGSGSGAVNVGGGAKTNVDVNVGASGSANTTAGSASSNDSAETDSSGDAQGSAESNTSAQINLGTVLTVTRADVDSGAVKANAKSAASVSTEADVSGFAAAKISSDARIARVETSSQKVSVGYWMDGKLFGFIPMTIETTAIANANGTVEVSHPWYGFLVKIDESADITTSVKNRVSGDLAASAEAGFSASTQARIVDHMAAALAASASGFASTQ